jgi:hypothetical protein
MSLSTMNWKRGLLRLWAVAAVLWVGVAFYSNDTVQRVDAAYALAHNLTPPWVSYQQDAKLKQAGFSDQEIQADHDRQRSIWPPLLDFAKLAFIPPLLLLALGYIGLWVGRGFRR